MTSGKERLTRACLGQEVDRVPWTPMIYQWFHVHQYNGTLPSDLLKCKTALDAMRVMRADLFAKHEAFIVHATYSACRFHSEYRGAKLRLPEVKTCLMDVFGEYGNVNFEGRKERHDYIITPKGNLTASWTYEEETGAPFETKNYWTDFDTEYERVRALLEDIAFIPDVSRWERVRADLDDNGIAHLRIPPTPLKMLHWLAGPERTIYFLADHPDEMQELARIYEAKRLSLVKQVVSLPESLVFTSGDNMDSLMYSPPLFEEFCGRSFRQIADVLHEEGKLLFTHACGQLAHVIKLCQDSGVDGMEGMAPPPVGDLNFSDARQLLGPTFVIQGGMTSVEEEMDSPESHETIFRRVDEIFSSLPNKRAFIFSSGCCPGPRARYENFLMLRDACWKYG